MLPGPARRQALRGHRRPERPALRRQQRSDVRRTALELHHGAPHGPKRERAPGAVPPRRGSGARATWWRRGARCGCTTGRAPASALWRRRARTGRHGSIGARCLRPRGAGGWRPRPPRGRTPRRGRRAAQRGRRPRRRASGSRAAPPARRGTGWARRPRWPRRWRSRSSGARSTSRGTRRTCAPRTTRSARGTSGRRRSTGTATRTGALGLPSARNCSFPGASRTTAAGAGRGSRGRRRGPLRAAPGTEGGRVHRHGLGRLALALGVRVLGRAAGGAAVAGPGRNGAPPRHEREPHLRNLRGCFRPRLAATPRLRPPRGAGADRRGLRPGGTGDDAADGPLRVRRRDSS